MKTHRTRAHARTHARTHAHTQHKGVAFDVYVAMGGGYLRRVLAMLWVTVLFALTLGLVRIYLHWCLAFLAFGPALRVFASSPLHPHAAHGTSRRRGILLSTNTAWSMMRFALITPGYAVGFLWPWARFLHPAFHPWELDDSRLLAAYSSLLQDPQAAPCVSPTQSL